MKTKRMAKSRLRAINEVPAMSGQNMRRKNADLARFYGGKLSGGAVKNRFLDTFGDQGF